MLHLRQNCEQVHFKGEQLGKQFRVLKEQLANIQLSLPNDRLANLEMNQDI